MDENVIRVALVGNPNVGKSTVFNRLTGLHQHTGNWPGKTVDVATGVCRTGDAILYVTDLPGCYSMEPHSAEEEVTRNHIISGNCDVAVVVCDASALERNLILALQIVKLCPHTVLVLNLIDEASRRGISVDKNKLEGLLGVPVVCTAARSGKGVEMIPKVVAELYHGEPVIPALDGSSADDAERIAKAVVTKRTDSASGDTLDRKLDRIFAGKYTAVPAMFLLVCVIMWLTVKGANYPSQLLSDFFGWLGEYLRRGLVFIGLPLPAVSCFVDGVYLVTAWVVSVMLPPMTIFFPLFTLLEDLGYLPRVAFNLDRFFKGCGSSGKQALTMCMGLGCNAAGVTGCRIIDSERERRIAILTNSLVPCNGRFPGIICLCAVFLGGSGMGGALCLTLAIAAGVGMTFVVSRFLTGSVLRGVPSSFTLELPPYRIPRIGSVIVRSIFDRTIFVLGRAVSVAAPAGLAIWIFANIQVGNTSLLGMMSDFLDPAGRFLGMDGVILTAFILGLPANEIVLPIAAMGYLSTGTLAELCTAELGTLFRSMGWDHFTAMAVISFSLFHWPCSTTLITVKKETGSTRMMIGAAVIPTLCGIAVCLLLRFARMVFGM